MIVGVNCVEAALLGASDRQGLFATIKGWGATEVRVEFPWEELKLSWAKTDAVYADAQAAGLNLLVMVAHPPAPTPPPATFGAVMQATAARYPQVSHFEVWNEQNAQRFWPKGSPETFVPYLKAAYEGIKAGNSQAQVVLGGLAACASDSRKWWQFWMPAYTNVDPVEYLTRLYAAGGGPYFDVLAHHPYSWDKGFRVLPYAPTNPFIAELPTLRTTMNNKGDGHKELWATEYGYQVSATLTAAQQSQYLQKQTADMAAGGVVDRAYTFCTRDFSTTIYGLLDKSNNPRPAASWFAQVAKA